MLKQTALNVFLWTVFFFAAIVTEEASLALWNGYFLTSTGSADQIAALPFIFVLAMVPVVSLMPFVAKIASPRRQLLIALSLASWAVILLVPVTRYLLLILAGVLYAAWWHPIQSTAGVFLALLPFPAAAVGMVYTMQCQQARSRWTRPLGAVGAVLLVLLALSGRDNSMCLGQWYGNFSLSPQSNRSAVHLVSLRLEANSKGSVGPCYTAFPEPPDSIPAKRFHSLFSGSVRWAQMGRSIRFYRQAAPANSLVAEGTVSADAETISLHFVSPSEAIVFRRDRGH